MRAWAIAAGTAMLAPGWLGCEPRNVDPGVGLIAESSLDAPGAAPITAVVASSEPASAIAPAEPAEERRIVRFAWRPPGADAAAYAMSDPDDQHRLVIVGRRKNGPYPVLIAMHGQPKRDQRPRDYAFPQTVIERTRELVEQGRVEPLVVALPVFRFRGTNWPAFDLVPFRAKIEQVLSAEGFTAGDFYVVGHSGAAGCGGDGMNRAHRIHPVAVGFFDTCLGSGWRDEVRALQRSRVPTSILQSVETAGVQPRRLREYDGRYDFGQVYRDVGLAPAACPAHLPEAPLRQQPYHCAADADAVVRAFVVDTGEGEVAHNALIGVALAYFLRAQLPALP